MDYEPLFNLPTGTSDIESVFRTERGSTYAHHSDATTTRNRSGAKHTDTSTGIQPRSGRTVYMDPKAVDLIGGLYQNPDMATKLLPEVDAKGKPTGRAQLKLTEDYGPRKAGDTLHTVPYETKPKVGLSPVEISGTESPIGSSGKNIHFGNKITEVYQRPSRLGKAGIAGALLSGAGAASAGELRQAAGDVAESFLPLGLTPSPLASGKLTPEQQQASDAAYAAKLAKEQAAKAKAQALLRSGVQMPDEYRRGGRVRMI